jgi:hypothetical protein
MSFLDRVQASFTEERVIGGLPWQLAAVDRCTLAIFNRWPDTPVQDVRRPGERPRAARTLRRG